MQTTTPDPGRPKADECLPYYFEYIDLVPDGHVVERLERQIDESAAFLATFTPEQALWREGPEEWNVVEIVGHLADVERVSSHRAFSIARAEPAKWTQVEFGAYAAAANFKERPLGDVVAEFAAVRAASVALHRRPRAASRGGHPPAARAVAALGASPTSAASPPAGRDSSGRASASPAAPA